MFSKYDYVYEIYRQGSFTLAAEKLFISQPSLSAAIKNIEKKLGAELFERTGKGIKLTEVGREYISATEKIMNIEKDFETKVNDIFNLAYQSGAVGYCFGENEDHGATPALPDEQTRQEYADLGAELIGKLVERFNMPHVVEQLRKLEAYGLENEQKYPWMPAAWNRNH